MDKPKRYAVIGDDGEVCAYLRDTLIQDGLFARAAKLKRNGNGIVLAHFHDTGHTWTVRQILEWADQVVVVPGMAAADATYETILAACGLQTSHKFAEKSEPLPVGANGSDDTPQDDSFGPKAGHGTDPMTEHDLTPDLGDPRYYGKLPESGEPPRDSRSGGDPVGCD